MVQIMHCNVTDVVFNKNDAVRNAAISIFYLLTQSTPTQCIDTPIFNELKLLELII